MTPTETLLTVGEIARRIRTNFYEPLRILRIDADRLRKHPCRGSIPSTNRSRKSDLGRA